MVAEPKRTAREEAPVRALAFLRGVARYPHITRVVHDAGYTREVHEEGWALLKAACGDLPELAPLTIDTAGPALRALDAWVRKHLPLLVAAVSRLRKGPAVSAVTALRTMSRSSGSLVAVHLFLDHLDGLEASSARDREAASALKTFASRGIDAAERRRLRGLVQSGKTIVASDDPPRAGEARDEALTQLHAWVTEWTATARSVVQRRADLISLGIARRSIKRK